MFDAEARAKVRRGDLIHYSYEPLADIRSETQRPSLGATTWSKFDKPDGLWVSVLGRHDWASWCRSEGFRATRRQAASRIHLRADAKVLRLSGADDLDAFTERYARDVQWGSRTWIDKVIPWDRVAEDWQGIIIAPYVWSRRLHDRTEWYYGWDCASGCIWGAQAISEVELLRAAAPPPPGGQG